MKSSKLGKNILEVEVQNIGPQGIWLLVRDREYFLSHRDFPWFKEAKLSDILEVELCRDHLHWAKLDVDLEIEALENPKNFPLIHKN
ncbi:MAG: DUF2442 domain-containing protein [Deltaproteobacteria bacterium]|nr:DUF2442 domain-containing protein [Deltaproteobacteria bacterium]